MTIETKLSWKKLKRRAHAVRKMFSFLLLTIQSLSFQWGKKRSVLGVQSQLLKHILSFFSLIWFLTSKASWNQLQKIRQQ